MAPALGPGACQVWWAPVDAAHPGLVAWLDAGERERLARIRTPADRRRFLVGHALLRAVVGAVTDQPPAGVRLLRERCRRCGAAHGRPRVDGARVSLSHSGALAAVAVTRDVDVGVDVEHVHAPRDHDLLAAAVLAPGERAALARLRSRERRVGLLRCWTRKEAVLKATGDGTGAGAARVEVSAPDEPAAVVAWDRRPRLVLPGGLSPPDPPDLHLQDLAGDPDHVACVAMLGARLAVSEHDGRGVLAAV